MQGIAIEGVTQLGEVDDAFNDVDEGLVGGGHDDAAGNARVEFEIDLRLARELDQNVAHGNGFGDRDRDAARVGKLRGAGGGQHRLEAGNRRLFAARLRFRRGTAEKAFVVVLGGFAGDVVVVVIFLRAARSERGHQRNDRNGGASYLGAP